MLARPIVLMSTFSILYIWPRKPGFILIDAFWLCDFKVHVSYRNYWGNLPSIDKIESQNCSILYKCFLWWSGCKYFGNAMQLTYVPMWVESSLWGQPVYKRLLIHWCLRWNASPCLCEQIYFWGCFLYHGADMDFVSPFKRYLLTFKACLLLFPLAESWKVTTSEDKLGQYFCSFEAVVIV